MTVRHSYAVSWSEPARPTLVGRLDLRRHGLEVEGRCGGGQSRRIIRYGEIEHVHVRRALGYRVLELRLAGRGDVRVASLDRPGSLGELADELRARTAKPHAGSGEAPMPVHA